MRLPWVGVAGGRNRDAGRHRVAGGWPWKFGLVTLAALVALPTVGLLVTDRITRNASEHRARQDNIREASTIVEQLTASYSQRVLLVSTVPAEATVAAGLAAGGGSHLARSLAAVAAKDGFCLLAVSAPGRARTVGRHGTACWDPPPASGSTPGIEIVLSGKVAYSHVSLPIRLAGHPGATLQAVFASDSLFDGIPPPSGGISTIVDGIKIIDSTRSSSIGTDVAAAGALRLIKSGHAGTTITYSPRLKTTVLTAYEPVAGSRFGVLVTVPTSIAFADANRLRRLLIIGYLGFVLVAVVLSGLVTSARHQRRRADAAVAAMSDANEQLAHARDVAVAATTAKSVFLATMSHEIRTPMNAVIGLTGLLLETELDAEQQDMAETVRQSGDALLYIINDILDFSKIEAGELDLEMQPFDLRDCVESAMALVSVAAATKGLELVSELADDCPATVGGDPTRFRQVVVNLLSNAVKFTDAGEVHVTVTCLPSATTDGPLPLTISVRDSGIGIPEDRMHRLFRSFSQVDSSTTRNYGGTGLGLVISRRLAQAMGGDLSVTSEVDVGSTFTFTAILEAMGDRRVPTEARPTATLVGRSILLVDDNATNLRVLGGLLRSWGMTCTEVDDPLRVLELVTGGAHFDGAVLDRHMPGMDGIQLAGALRTQAGEVPMPMVLLASSCERVSPQQRALFVATLTKPVRSSLLREKLLLALQPAEALLHDLETAGGRRRGDGPAAPTRPLRVLVAEDNPVNQRVAKLMLEKLGHHVDTVSDGLEAVDAAHRSPFDIILMDVQMPQLDGLQAAARIRAELPSDRQPRIVAVTANVMAEDRAACLGVGMDDFLAKPIRTAELAAILDFEVRPPSDQLIIEPG